MIGLQPIGLSYLEISGSKVICTYPEAYRSLSRPSSPESQGIRHVPLLTFSLTDNVWSIYTFSFNFTFSVTSCQRSFENIPINWNSRVENNGFER